MPNSTDPQTVVGTVQQTLGDSRQLVVKASEHEIKACGVRVNGGPEARIIALHKAERR